MDQLRCAAEFEVALDRARSHESLLVQAKAAAWRIADARREIATLERLCALPDSTRSEWQNRARSAFTVMTDSVIDSPETPAAIQAWIDFLERHVGAQSLEVAAALSEQARFNERRERLLLAFELEQRAAAIRGEVLGEEHPEIAASLHRSSFFLRRAGGPRAEAMKYCERGLAMRQRLLGEGAREVGESLLQRGNFHRVMNDLEAAIADMAAAAAIFRRTEGENSLRLAEALTDQALTHSTKKEWRTAVRLLQEALKIRRSIAGSPDELLALALNEYGMALRELGRLDEAETILREAIQVQEERWRASAPDRGRANLLTLAAHKDLALTLVQQGRAVEAWSVMEKSVSRVAVEAAIARGDIEPDPWPNLLQRVQRTLPDSTALVGWLERRSGAGFWEYPFWCYVVRATGEPRWFRVDAPAVDSKDIRRDVGRLTIAIEAEAAWPLERDSFSDLEQRCREIYRIRIAPMAAALAGVSTLVVTSQDMNHGAPIEALMDDEGRYVAERFATVYSPSALLYSRACERRRMQPRSLPRQGLLVSPDLPESRGTSSLPLLASAAREIEHLRDALPSYDVLLGTRASEATLDSLRAGRKLEHYDFIHFATHMRPRGQWVNQSALLLDEARRTQDVETGPDAAPTIDGWLTAAEIAARWRLNARLVSLGSCFGSSITINRSSGPQGVAPAFLEAGARCVLASAFSVDDEASAIFFQRFAHLALATDGPRLDLPTAVQRARMWLRQYRAPDGSRPYASPALWSTFILLGWPE